MKTALDGVTGSSHHMRQDDDRQTDRFMYLQTRGPNPGVNFWRRQTLGSRSRCAGLALGALFSSPCSVPGKDLHAGGEAS